MPGDDELPGGALSIQDLASLPFAKIEVSPQAAEFSLLDRQARIDLGEPFLLDGGISLGG